MRSELASRLRTLLKLELYFTVLPAIVFPVALLALSVSFPWAAVVVLTVGFVYLLPAFVIVNGLGHKTVHGAPPLPIPADSPSGLLVLIATHAALVAVLYLSYAPVAAAVRWWDRVLERAWEAVTKTTGKNSDPRGRM